MLFDNDYPKKKIAKGNPYYCCASCGMFEPHINGQLENHSDFCEYRKQKITGLLDAGKYAGRTLVDSIALSLVIEQLIADNHFELVDLIEESMINFN